MLALFSQTNADDGARLAAFDRSQAVIEFDPDGVILTANGKFLDTVGYTLDEIRGKHHSLFVDPGFRSSAGYAVFWRGLKQGKYQAARYRRFGKGGREIWIEASYDPLLDACGRPYKVVKFATHPTQQVNLLLHLRQIVDRQFGEIGTAPDRSGQEAREATAAVNSTSSNVQRMASAAIDGILGLILVLGGGQNSLLRWNAQGQGTLDLQCNIPSRRFKCVL